jgi:hypothetical protein
MRLFALLGGGWSINFFNRHEGKIRAFDSGSQRISGFSAGRAPNNRLSSRFFTASASLLASAKASRLNQNLADSGIPPRFKPTAPLGEPPRADDRRASAEAPPEAACDLAS